MKSIALDFKNNMICFMTAGQQGTETNPDLKKVAWLDRDINIIFIDNPTVSSDYIKHMTAIAKEQDIVTKTA